MDINPLASNGLKVLSEATQLEGQEIVKIHGQNCFDSMIQSISDAQQDAQPFYILDIGTVVKLMDRWTRSLPNVTPFYAVKCNPEPSLLAALATLEAGFDCATMAEIDAVLGLGVASDRIVYANPVKQVSHIKHAAKVGVNLTTFDSREEIDKIVKWHSKSELPLRIRVPNDSTSGRSVGTKYGASPEEVLPLLKHAHNLSMKVVGVSFHVGSKASESDIYRRAINAAKFAFDTASLLNMPPMHILNIGGGSKANPLFNEIAKTINESIDKFFPDQQSLKVIAEPGRFFVETAFTMVTNVIGKRVRGEQIQYWIDDGIYGSFNLTVFDRCSMVFKSLKKELLNMNEDGSVADSGTKVSSMIFGPTCDAVDIVVKDCKLPEMEVDDLVVFYNMGAYSSAAGTVFNGFHRIQLLTYLAYSA